MIEMSLARILIRENADQQVILLKEKGGERAFPILIGMSEAAEINRKITEVETPRPMTHDLLRSVVAGLGAQLSYVLLDQLRDSCFHAKLCLERNDEHLRIDSRASDAIALAVAAKVPIYAEERVVEEAVQSLE